MSAITDALGTVLSLNCLWLMLLGVGVGIIFGAFPGMSATLALSVFLPMTFALSTEESIVLLMSLYIGGISGGLISAILINIPGTPSSVATTFDGAPLARKGQGAKALGVAIIFSALGTIFSAIALLFIGPTLAKAAIKFGSYEYFSLMVCALLMVSSLSGKSLLKGIISAIMGLTVGMIGLAPVCGTVRFTFGIQAMMAGIPSIPCLTGLFAFPELLRCAKKGAEKFETMQVPKFKGFGFSLQEFLGQAWNGIRSFVIGLAVGILPGIGSGASNLLAYGVARNASKTPEKFGTGIIDGVVASETANNASIGGAMIPFLALGVPGDAVTAILLGGFMLQGISTGPLFFTRYASLSNIIFVCMIIATVVMVVMEFFGMRLFVKLLKLPLHVILTCVMTICVLGSYVATNNAVNMWIFLAIGVLGFLMSEFEVPLPPFIIGFVLGPNAEMYLRRGMQFSHNSFIPFLQSPIAATFFGVSLAFILFKTVKGVRAMRAASRKKAEQ